MTSKALILTLLALPWAFTAAPAQSGGAMNHHVAKLEAVDPAHSVKLLFSDLIDRAPDGDVTYDAENSTLTLTCTERIGAQEFRQLAQAHGFRLAGLWCNGVDQLPMRQHLEESEAMGTNTNPVNDHDDH